MTTNDTSIPEGFKRCSKCKEVKPATTEYFNKRSDRKSGLMSWCKVCVAKHAEGRILTAEQSERARQQAKKWYDENRERAKKQRKEYRDANPETIREQKRQSRLRHLDKKRAKDRDYARAHPEEARERSRKYAARHRQEIRHRRNEKYHRNPEMYRAYGRNWYAKDRSKTIATAHRRRARKHALPDNFTVQDWQRALTYFDYRCAACGRPQGLWHKLSPDHWIPLSDPRPDNPGTVPTNIVPLCHNHKDGTDGCNNTKSNKDAEQWLVEQFGKRTARKVLKRIRAYFDGIIELPTKQVS